MTTSTKESIIIVCAADNRYAMPLAVVIRSVLENVRSDRLCTFFIIDGGISQKNKNKILKVSDSKQCIITWLKPPDDILDNMKVSGHIKVATYYKILIPILLPDNYCKAIYLDSDLIVQGDLGKLWDINIENNYLLAVQDSGIPYVSSYYGLQNYKELGIPLDYKYFNAGVLVLNLEKMRKQSTSTQVIQYLEDNKQHIRWHDQDGLNAVLAGKWGELEPRWNQLPSIYNNSSWKDSPFSQEEFTNALKEPYIIHFASSSKPWNSTVYHPANDLFFHYLDMTPWVGWRWTIWRRIWRKIIQKIQFYKEKYQGYCGVQKAVRFKKNFSCG
ncbi:glycosyltransferase family 8 protein [Brasilonema sp. UFV-L1]|nr:glycosyltransferase family 8 protein [Brasilonema sp. UFV-L1]